MASAHTVITCRTRRPVFSRETARRDNVRGMSTPVPESLYSPDYTKKQLEAVLKVILPMMEEILRRGLLLFDRYAQREGSNDDDLVICFVFRHILDLFDAVNILTAECAPAMAALQLRAMMESLMSLEYLTEVKSKTPERALAYRFVVEMSRREFYLQQDPNTEEGKNLRRYIDGSPYAMEWKPIDPGSIAGHLKQLDEILNRQEYKFMAKALKKAEKRGRNPNWYSVHGGPRNVRELAQYLKHADWYAFLYTEWSERGHGRDVIDRVLTHGTQGAAARSLRDVTEFNSTLDFAIVFAMDAMRAVIKYYNPSDDAEQSAWYAKNVAPVKVPNIEVKFGDKK